MRNLIIDAFAGGGGAFEELTEGREKVMLVEKSVKEALIDYAKGRKVVVLQCSEDGKMDANLLYDFLEYDNNKYLVDVPAVVNPEFEAAVQDMMKGSEVITPAEEDVNEEPAESEVEESESANDEDGEEKQLPPPQQRRNWKKKR
ncbi:hypothetical protein [Bariatricus sp. HCP28S3_D3]|uniref:hypothetical protein n=1 Tax=Bariatricus sp. HCP28S3_D3 TaxID=3438901 RepID=UPI003F8CCF36